MNIVSPRPQEEGPVKDDTEEVLLVWVENVSLFTTKNNAQVKSDVRRHHVNVHGRHICFLTNL